MVVSYHVNHNISSYNIYSYVNYVVRGFNITKTRLYKYTENFTTKKWKFSDKKILIFFILLLKT